MVDVSEREKPDVANPLRSRSDERYSMYALDPDIVLGVHVYTYTQKKNLRVTG